MKPESFSKNLTTWKIRHSPPPFFEFTSRQTSLKSRGFTEGWEGTQDLIHLMGGWLVRELRLEDGIAPVLIRVFRLGTPSNPHRKYPLDIVVTFADIKVRKSILETTRSKVHLHCRNTSIVDFQDLPKDALQLCHQFKLITTVLREAHFRYERIFPGKNQVLYQGQYLCQLTKAQDGAALSLKFWTCFR